MMTGLENDFKFPEVLEAMVRGLLVGVGAEVQLDKIPAELTDAAKALDLNISDVAGRIEDVVVD